MSFTTMELDRVRSTLRSYYDTYNGWMEERARTLGRRTRIATFLTILLLIPMTVFIDPPYVYPSLAIPPFIVLVCGWWRIEYLLRKMPTPESIVEKMAELRAFDLDDGEHHICMRLVDAIEGGEDLQRTMSLIDEAHRCPQLSHWSVLQDLEEAVLRAHRMHIRMARMAQGHE